MVFHKCDSFNWFVRDVRIFGKLPDISVGISVVICLVLDVFNLTLKSPVMSRAVQLNSSVLGHCTSLWFRSGTSNCYSEASSVPVCVSSGVLSEINGFRVSNSSVGVSFPIFFLYLVQKLDASPGTGNSVSAGPVMMIYRTAARPARHLAAFPSSCQVWYS